MRCPRGQVMIVGKSHQQHDSRLVVQESWICTSLCKKNVLPLPPRERLRRTSPQVALLPRAPAELVDRPRTLLVPLSLGDPMGA